MFLVGTANVCKGDKDDLLRQLGFLYIVREKGNQRLSKVHQTFQESWRTYGEENK
jgi:hypothetical protein